MVPFNYKKFLLFFNFLGKWINATGGRLFEVKNPYTREAVADVSSCDLQDAQLVKYLGLFDNRRSSIEVYIEKKLIKSRMLRTTKINIWWR